MKLFTNPLLFCFVILSFFQTGFNNFEFTDIAVDACTGNPVISSPTVTSITSTGATLGGDITNAGSGGSCSLSERGVAYSTTTGEPATLAPPATVVVTAGTSTGIFTQAVSGLTAATQYFYVAYGKNSNGNSTTTESSFYTLANSPSGNYTGTLSATGSATNQIDLTFTDVTSVPLTSTSGYIVLRRQGSNPTTASLNDGASPTSATYYHATISSTSATSYNDITGLSAGTEYRYALIPFNWDGANNGTYSYNVTAGFTVTSGFTYSNEPTTNPTLSASGSSSSQIDLTYSSISASGYVILRKQGSAPSAAGLVDGSAPGGTDLLTTVANNSSPFNNTTGLTAGLEYFYTLVPFNWDGANAATYNYYLTSNPTTSAFTFSTAPSAQYTGSITASGFSSSQIDLSFSSITTAGITNASGYIVLRRQGSNPTTAGLNGGAAPSSATYYLTTINSTAANSYSDMASLSAQTEYRYALIPFNWDGANDETYNYNTTGGFTVGTGYTFSPKPVAHPASFTALASSATQINLIFSAASTILNADGYIILRRTDGSNPTNTGVTDGVAPGSLPLTIGTTLVTTITNSATTTYNNNSLTAGTQYNYAIIPYNWDGSNAQTYNYLTDPTIKTDFDTPSNGVNITQAATTSVCSGSQVTLTDITIAEVGKNDFITGGTLLYELNDLAFSFVPSQGTVSTSPIIGSSTDITSISMVVNASRITITFALDGSNDKKESIILSGIKITYDGSVAPSAQIVRTGGTSTINGIGSSDLGTINSGSPAPAPIVSFSPTAYCQGDVISPGPNVTSNNTAVKWYTDAGLTNEIVALAGITNINTPILLSQLGFVTTGSGTINRYVTQQPGTCKSAGTIVTITVQPKPVADITITGGSSTLCTNYVNGSPNYETVQFTASPSGAANYDFRINGVSTQNGASRILNRNANNFTTGNSVDVIITVAGSCPSTSNSIGMTKNVASSTADFVVTTPPPNTPNTISTFSNQEPPVNLTGSPAGGVFSGPGMVGNDFYPSGVPLGQHTITYTVTTTGCTDVKTRTFEVYDGTTSVLGLATDYCSADANFTMDVANNSIPGTTFLYILPLSNYSVNLLPFGSVKAENGLPGVYQEVTAANEINWFKGFAITSSPIHISPSLIASTGNKIVTFYAVYKDNVTSATITRTQNVNFYQTPPQPLANYSSGYCLGGPSILTEQVVAIGQTGALFRWYNDPGLSNERVSLSGNGAPTLLELGVSDASPGTTLRYVTQTTNGCQSAPRLVTINVYAKPSVPTTASPPAICSGGDFAIVNVTGTAVQWYTIYPTNPINPANPLAVTATTDLSVPSTNFTSSPVSYDRFVTQTINGCTSNPFTVTFTINPIPLEPPVINNTPSFCKDQDIDSSPPITVTSGTNIKWYRDNTPTGPINQITPIANQFAATSIELGLDSSIPSTTNFYITQTANGCESPPKIVTVTIIDLASVSISIEGGQSLTSVCKTGIVTKLKAIPGGGVWSGPAAAGLINIVAGTNPPAPAIGTPSTAELDPSNSNLLPGQSYNLTYTSSGGCSNSDTKLVTILPSVNPSLVIGDACAGTFVDINNTSVVVPGGATIDQIGYQFGDNGSIPPGSGVIPNGSDGGKTKGTYDNPQHRYSNIGLFPITYTMTTSDGCVVVGNQNVQISEVPQINFSWRNACLGGSMEFMANVTNGVAIPAGNFTWDFAKNSQLTFGAAGTGSSPNVNYDITGTDIVELIVKSAANCKDTIQKQVFVVPVAVPITTNTPYSEDFNSGNGGWSSGGSNSSWQYGTPSSVVINRDSSATGTGRAWKTNLSGNNNANERSYVLSPCFDFSGASRPVISLDIWSNTPRGVDGAVLQYNVSGNLENESNWIVVGQVGSGINWYDQNNISSKPGNQTSIDAGWTGDENSTTKYKSWKRATFSLDAIVGQPQVNFRIAFAATVSGGEGFAFDNFLIGERTRTVLIENFTNSSTKAGQAARLQNEEFNTFKNNSIELVKIQYHTSFPGDDPINDQNKAIYDARSAFYGLTSAPSARLDGLFKDGPFTTWGEPFYDDRVLDPTFLRIESIDAQKVDGVVKINTRLLATGPIPKNLFVHTVIVEKEITEPSLLGQNGDQRFLYVVRKMLPSPAGHKITNSLVAGETYDVPEIIWDSENFTTPGNGAIVVFVQQDTITSKAIYQSRIVLNPPQPDLVTGIGESPSRLDQIAVYPNPVDAELTVQLPYPSRQDVFVKLADPVGKIVYDNTIFAGESTKTINTRNFIGGIYLLRIENGKGNVTYRKVMVVHNK